MAGGEVHLVEVLVEEHRDLEERARAEPGDVNAAVLLQPEQCPQTFFAAARRAEFDLEMRDVRSWVPEPVRSTGRYDHDLACPGEASFSAEPELQQAGDAFEAFPLARVDVTGHEAAGPDEKLAGHATRAALAEDDALARDRVADDVYAFDQMI
jgi:hypothetical protein